MRKLFKTKAGIALMVAVSWQLFMTVSGILFDYSTNYYLLDRDGHHQQSVTVLSHTMHWDAGWYIRIINGEYADPESAASVFFPVFPVAVQAVKIASLHTLGDASAGLVVNTVALFFALWALMGIADIFFKGDKSQRKKLLILFLTFPTAVFCHFFYSEAIFCALAFWSYLFALRREWWKVGLTLAILTATRSTAILFVLLAGLEFMRAYDWKLKKILNPNILWFLLAPSGLLLFSLYLYFVRGDPIAMIGGFHLTNDWAYHKLNFNFFYPYYLSLAEIKRVVNGSLPFDTYKIINHVMPAIMVLLTFIASLYAIVKIKIDGSRAGVPLGVFGLATIFMISINSNLVSVNRYLLPTIVIYIAVAHYLSNSSLKKHSGDIIYIMGYVGVMLQMYLLVLFARNIFAG